MPSVASVAGQSSFWDMLDTTHVEPSPEESPAEEESPEESPAEEDSQGDLPEDSPDEHTEPKRARR